MTDADAGRTVPSPEVSLKTAKLAWDWMLNVLYPHAMAFYEGVLGGGEGARWYREFVDFVLPRYDELLAYGGGKQPEITTYFMRSNWTAHRQEFYDSGNERVRREYFRMLVDSGAVRQVGNSKRYLVNPRLWQVFADRISELAEKRAAYNKPTEATAPFFAAQKRARKKG